MLDRHAAESERRFIGAGEVKLAAEPARYRIVVDLEGVAQAVDVASDHAESGVDLFAAVFARIAEREQAVGADLGSGVLDEAVGHRHVAVLDDDVRAAVAPERVPGAHVLAGEDTLDSRPPERAGHAAVELAAPRDGNGPGAGAEVGQQAGEHLVAFLPVGARDVELELRVAAPCGRAVEDDVRAFGGEPAVLGFDAVRVEAVRDLAADRQVRDERRGRRRSPLLVGALQVRGPRFLQRGTHRLDSGRRRDGHLAVAAALAKAPRRPDQQIASGRAAGESQAAELVEIGNLREIDVGVAGVESGRRGGRRSERADRETEPRVAAVQLGARLGHLEAGARPVQAAEQRRKAIAVHAGQVAGKAPGEIVTALEQVKRPVELAVAREPPAFLLEEDLAHARKLHARFHRVGLLGPVREIQFAGGFASGAVGLEIDPVHQQTAAVDGESRLHVRPHRRVALNVTLPPLNDASP